MNPHTKQPLPQRLIAVFLDGWGWVGLLTLAGLLFRLWHLGDKSLWGDEIFTIAHAFGTIANEQTLTILGQKLSLPEAATTTDYLNWLMPKDNNGFEGTINVLKSNNHPPLFFLMMNSYLHGLLAFFGSFFGFSLRLPAVLFGTACIPAMYLIGQQIHSRAVGVFAAGLMALSGYQVYHSQDARPYTLTTLLALVFIWLVLRQRQQRFNLWGWITIGLIGLTGVYTHYFFLPVLLLGLLLGLFYKPDEDQPYFRNAYFKGLGISYLIMGLGFLPWIPVLLEQLAFTKLASHYTAALWNPFQLPEILFRYSLEFIAPGMNVAKTLLILMVATSTTMVFYVRQQKPGWNRLLTLCLLWLGCVYGFQIAFDLLTESSTTTVRRYVLLAAPAVYLLFGYALFELKAREALIQNTWLIILTGLLVYNSSLAVNGEIFTNPDYTVVMAKINQLNQANQVNGEANKKQKATIITNKLENAVALSWASRSVGQQPLSLTHLTPVQVGNADDATAVDLQLKQASESYPRLSLVWVKAAPSLKLYAEKQLAGQGYLLQHQEKLSKVVWQQYVRDSEQN